MVARYLKPTGWFIAGLIVLSLCGCSHPCDKYLKYPPKIPPVRYIVPPKPISLFQLREYYLCLLERYGVQVIRLGQTWKIILPSDDLFDNDTTQMKSTYKPILKIVTAFLRTYSKITVKVSAFTDQEANESVSKFGTTISQDLTRRQAEEVSRYLAYHCINARLIYGEGQGGDDPVAWPGSPAGRYLNRRVEIDFRYYRDSRAWY